MQSTLSILVTGSQGQLGSALYEAAQAYRSWSFHYYTREGLDITRGDRIREVLEACRPDLVINAAAYTAVDRAEDEPDRAFAVNEGGAGLLAKHCAELDVGLVHLSTDYVYHNELRRPLLETDPVHPVGVYARSKLAGELAVQASHPGAYVVRTSWLYGMHGQNFVKTMLRLAAERPELRVVDDQVGSPTYANDLAGALLALAGPMASGDMPAGVYNYANAGQTTWYGLAREAFKMAGRQVDVRPITTADYPTPAERPPYSVLDCSKIAAHLDGGISSWERSLQKCISRLAFFHVKK
jgi:dTDP-4-dehydrorhamnose reductase